MKNPLTEAVKILRQLKLRYDRLEEKEFPSAILTRLRAIQETSLSKVLRTFQAFPIETKDLWQPSTLQPGEKRIEVDLTRIYWKVYDGEAQYNKDNYNYGEYQ